MKWEGSIRLVRAISYMGCRTIFKVGDQIVEANTASQRHSKKKKKKKPCDSTDGCTCVTRGVSEGECAPLRNQNFFENSVLNEVIWYTSFIMLNI